MRNSCGTSNLMFPDTGRELTPDNAGMAASGCRGFIGLVPQPLCMKFKVCSLKSKLCGDTTENARRESRGMCAVYLQMDQGSLDAHLLLSQPG